MSANSSKFSLAIEDRWMIASVSNLAKLVEPVGPLATLKRQWISDTRRLLKEISAFITRELPVGEVGFEELAAVIGSIEDTLLDLGVKLAGPETPDEAEVAAAETEPERTEAEEAETEEAAAEQQQEAADLPELTEEGAEPAEDDAEPAEDVVEPVLEAAVQPAEARGPLAADEASHLSCFYCDKAHPVCKCAVLRAKPDKLRLAIILEMKTCFNCFSKKHRVYGCPELHGRCIRCPERHHTMLHGLV